MAIAFACGERIGDAVQIDQQRPVVDGAGPEPPPVLGRLHLRDPLSKRLVDDVPERAATLGAQPLEPLHDVRIQRQGRSHTSKHTRHDALMLTAM